MRIADLIRLRFGTQHKRPLGLVVHMSGECSAVEWGGLRRALIHARGTYPKHTLVRITRAQRAIIAAAIAAECLRRIG